MWGKEKRINVLEVRMQWEGAFIQRKVRGDIGGQTKRGRSMKAGAEENVESKYEPQIIELFCLRTIEKWVTFNWN